MSGVTDCKVVQGLGAYGIEAEEVDDSIIADETIVNVEGGNSTSDPSVQANLSVSDGTVATADANATTMDEGAPTSFPTTGLPLEGPFENEMTRIILYGFNATAFMDDTSSMDRWKSITESYIEDFFNDYSPEEEESDVVRSSIFDVLVTIAEEVWELAPEHDFDPLVAGEVDVRDVDACWRNLRRGGRSSAAARRAQVSMD
jgi:hypothetical protein